MVSFGTWCSGIEAASEAWLPLGWQCAYVAEIEPFPCAYLGERHSASRPRHMPRPEDATKPAEIRARRAAIRAIERLGLAEPGGPELQNFGDITQVKAADLPAVDMIGVGFPCQDFSIAGLRASLTGGRGSLSIIGVRLLLELAELGSVRGALLEQVPAVLNTPDNAWGNILGALVGADAALPGYANAKPKQPEHFGRWPREGMVEGPRARAAWRLLDAQHFRLAQRRERVFAVIDFGDGPDPAAVLFEPQGMPGHPSESFEARQDVAQTLVGGARGRGGYSEDDRPLVASALRARPGSKGVDSDATDTLIAGAVDASLGRSRGAGTPPSALLAFGGNNSSGPIDVAMARNAHGGPHGRQQFETETFVMEVAPTVRASHRKVDNAGDEGLLIAHTLRGEGFDATEDGTGRGTPLIPEVVGHESTVAFDWRQDPIPSDKVGALAARTDQGQAIAVPIQESGKRTGRSADDKKMGLGVGADGDPMFTMGADSRHAVAVAIQNATSSRGDQNGLGMSADDRMYTLTSADQHAVAFSMRGRDGVNMPEPEPGGVCPALRSADGGSTRPFVAFDETQITRPSTRANPQPGDPCHPLMASARPPTLASTMAVRRITPLEGEILQGFGPNATLVHWPSAGRKGEDLAETIAYLRHHGYPEEEAQRLAQTPDGPRYKAIGNSWPVPVIRWLGIRIQRYMGEKK